MKTLFVLSLACLAALVGCASTGQMRQVESTSEANQKLLHETDQRLRTLEQSVAALDSQVASLNNRQYEVRTRGGRKTGMTVVPLIPSGPSRSTEGTAAPATPQAREQTAAGPKGFRTIDPAAPPASFPADAQAASGGTGRKSAVRTASVAPNSSGPSGQLGGPERTAGPSGQLASSVPGELALPPAEALLEAAPQRSAPAAASDTRATSPAAAPAGNTAVVPVPTLPPSDLALPPEHPDLPPLDAALAPAATAGTAAVPAVPAVPAVGQKTGKASDRSAGTSAKSEEAAYKSALQVTLSGRAAEGVSRFQSFLQEYPHGRYAANAEYWIGEGLYAQGKYAEALAQFRKVGSAYPRHHKNADALLKAGMCLSRLGDKQAAAQEYKTLLTSFPNSEAARLVRARGLTR